MRRAATLAFLAGVALALWVARAGGRPAQRS